MKYFIFFILIFFAAFECRFKNKKLQEQLIIEHRLLEEEHMKMQAVHDSLESNFLILLERRIKKMEKNIQTFQQNLGNSSDFAYEVNELNQIDHDHEYALLIDAHSKILKEHSELLTRHEHLIIENQKGKIDEDQMLLQDKKILDEEKKMKEKHMEIAHTFMFTEM